MERQKFLGRMQKAGESHDTFLTDLKNFASICELDSLHFTGLIGQGIVYPRSQVGIFLH